ncbi:MAG TPA: hypothetical protein VMF90_12680 [Rhizobiaceae bacterium]|nr:hypothetical protein [Rhizobiaceae bacterium]
MDLAQESSRLNNLLLKDLQGAALPKNDTVVQFAMTPAKPMSEKPKAQNKVDWSATVDLIREATEAMRASEERARDLETRITNTILEASHDINALTAQLATADRTIEQLQDRAQLAEERAEEAEAWLARLHETISASFVPKQRRDATTEIRAAASR